MCLGELVEHVSECTGGACVWVYWWSMMSGCAGGACVWVCWWSMCLSVLVEHVSG